jgi:hypothetical protein
LAIFYDATITITRLGSFIGTRGSIGHGVVFAEVGTLENNVHCGWVSITASGVGHGRVNEGVGVCESGEHNITPQTKHQEQNTQHNHTSLYPRLSG